MSAELSVSRAKAPQAKNDRRPWGRKCNNRGTLISKGRGCFVSQDFSTVGKYFIDQELSISWELFVSSEIFIGQEIKQFYLLNEKPENLLPLQITSFFLIGQNIISLTALWNAWETFFTCKHHKLDIFSFRCSQLFTNSVNVVQTSWKGCSVW